MGSQDVRKKLASKRAPLATVASTRVQYVQPQDTHTGARRSHEGECAAEYLDHTVPDYTEVRAHKAT